MEKPRWPLELQPLSWGAESNLYLTRYLGFDAVLKHRFPKRYMDERLTKGLIRTRTLREASLLMEARRAGVAVPLPLYVDADSGILVVKYVAGKLVKEVLEERGPEAAVSLSCTMGGMVRRLHNADIIHGDLTTSNFIVSGENRLFLIDFGLAFKSKRPEDKATDIRVFERAVVSTHPDIRGMVMESFLTCYTDGLVGRDEIMERYQKLSLMGRYVRERRRDSRQV